MKREAMVVTSTSNRLSRTKMGSRETTISLRRKTTLSSEVTCLKLRRSSEIWNSRKNSLKAPLSPTLSRETSERRELWRRTIKANRISNSQDKKKCKVRENLAVTWAKKTSKREWRLSIQPTNKVDKEPQWSMANLWRWSRNDPRTWTLRRKTRTRWS